MDATSIFLDKVSIKFDTQSKIQDLPAKSTSFDNVFKQSESRYRPTESRNVSSEKQRRSANEVNNVNKRQLGANSKVSNNEAQRGPEATKSNDNVSGTVTQPDKGNAQETDKPEDNAIKSIAKLLNAPDELVAQILNQLNLHPSDLTEKENLKQFLKAFYELESDTDLLLLQDIGTIFADITKIAEEAKNVKNLAIQENISDQTLQTDSADQEQNDLLNTSKRKSEAETDNTSLNEVPVTKAEQSFSIGQEDGTAKAANTKNLVENLPLEAGLDGHEAEGKIFTAANQQVVFRDSMNKAEAVKNINTPDVVNQIIDKLKVEIKGNVSEVRMLLHPEALGEVSLKIATRNGIVTAQFVAENQRIKEIIEANFQVLKNTLQQKGIEISALSVSVGQDSNNEAMSGFLREQRKSSSRIQQIIRAEGLDEAEEDTIVYDVDTADVLNNNVDYSA